MASLHLLSLETLAAQLSSELDNLYIKAFVVFPDCCLIQKLMPQPDKQNKALTKHVYISRALVLVHNIQ